MSILVKNAPHKHLLNRYLCLKAVIDDSNFVAR